MTTENTTINPRDIELTLTSSRPTLELGEPWEILLAIKNHTDQAIWITDIATTLTLPAEVIHPGESNVASRGAQLPTISGPGYDIVSIPPKGRYMCTWRVNGDAKELTEKVGKWEVIRWHMFFHPAQYAIQANIHIWTERPDIGKLSQPSALQRKLHLQSDGDIKQMLREALEQKMNPQEQKDESDDHAEQPIPDDSEPPKDLLEQLAPLKKEQADVMAGSMPLIVNGHINVSIKSTAQFQAAALGGGLAFLFREFYAMSNEGMALKFSDFALLPTYVLAAVLISLFVSRITEARFPLTIKIMDFWGATAFGVLAAFAGDAILSKILNFLSL